MISASRIAMSGISVIVLLLIELVEDLLHVKLAVFKHSHAPLASASLCIRETVHEVRSPGFEGTLRDSAEELLRVTGYPCDTEKGEVDDNAIDLVDPNVAITFVVAAPLTGEELPEFSFALFCDFAYDLEDRLLDEADELREKKGMPHFGEEVTIAPFHPDWKFAGNDGEIDGTEADKSDSVAWEKRTPYPTISLVRTSAIAAAGCDATSRIAVHNEEVLSELGSHALGELFRERVLQGISRNLYS